MYNIKAIYTTSDSFNPPEETFTVFGLNNKDIELAKENLRRLKEHYEYYQAKNDRGSYWDKEAEKKSQIIIDAAKQKPWFVPKYSEFSVILLLDNNVNYQISVPYCGYFEELISLEIIMTNEDRKVEF